MGTLAIVLIILFVIVAVLMSFFVLIQDEQGEGLGGLMGGGSSSAFGAASNTVLTRITAVSGALFILFSIGVAFFVKTPDKDQVEQEAKRLQAEGQTIDWFAVNNETMGNTIDSDLIIPEE